MITKEEILSYINTSGADFSNIDFQSAIDLAYRRYREITGSNTVDDSDPAVKKALILLAVSELAGQVNLYWRGKENTEVIRTKDVVAEVERILKPKTSAALRFAKL